MSLKNRLIPPSLNFEEPNPQLEIDESPFYINNRLKEWNTEGIPRRGGISSFGIGGTNAHIIVEEAPLLGESESPESIMQLCCQPKPKLLLMQ
jgi:acyl transferase domain-containing protein